jgi:hypothetical protein
MFFHPGLFVKYPPIHLRAALCSSPKWYVNKYKLL